MSRVTEAEVADAVESILHGGATGHASIQELIREIPNHIALSADDLRPSPTRRNEAIVDKDKKTYEIVVDDNLGIVDGAHTAKLIEEAQADDDIPDEQHVEVYVRTGLPAKFVAEIAKGLNTGIQVRPQSIYAIDGVF